MSLTKVTLPVVDFAESPGRVALLLREACTEHGFFYAANHGVSERVQTDIVREARAFFARPLHEKTSVALEKGGRALRGYFPVGGELTSGHPDFKEGYYLGEELSAAHPEVRAQTPLHGPNLFPSDAQGAALAAAVSAYIAELAVLGHRVTRSLAQALGIAPEGFDPFFPAGPLALLRLFLYPAQGPSAADAPALPGTERTPWGVGEHTDYGFLTFLLQDDVGGLQVKSRGAWLDAPPIAGTFVCNIGDMLERITGGLFLSTPHRVRNASARERLSIPYFFDPSFHARTFPLAAVASRASREAALQVARWDAANVHAFSGEYGDYIMSKIARVFPQFYGQELK